MVIKILTAALDRMIPSGKRASRRHLHSPAVEPFSIFYPSTKRMFSYLLTKWINLPKANIRALVGIFSNLALSDDTVPFLEKSKRQKLAREAFLQSENSCPRMQGLCEFAVGFGITMGYDAEYPDDEPDDPSLRAVIYLTAARNHLRSSDGDEFYLFQTLVHLAATAIHTQAFLPDVLDNANTYALEAEALLERMWTFGTDQCEDKRYRSGLDGIMYRSQAWHDICVNGSKHLALVFVLLNEPKKVTETYRHLAENVRRFYPLEHPTQVVVHKLLGDSLFHNQHRYMEAAAIYRRVRVQNRASQLYCVRCEDGLTVQRLVTCFYLEGKWQDLIEEVESVDLLKLVIQETVDCSTLASIRAAYAWLGRDHKVVQMCQQFELLHDQWFGTSSAMTLRCLEEKWAALHRLGRPEEALAQAREMLHRITTAPLAPTQGPDSDETSSQSGSQSDESNESASQSGSDSGSLAGDDAGDEGESVGVGHPTAPVQANEFSISNLGFGESTDSSPEYTLRWRTVRAHWNVAWSLTEVGRFDEASYHLRRCLFYLGRNKSPSPEDHTMTRNVLCQLAFVYESQGLVEEASVAFAEAQATFRSEPHTKAGAALYGWLRGKMFLYRGMFEEATQTFLFVRPLATYMFAVEAYRDTYDAEDIFAPRPRNRVGPKNSETVSVPEQSGPDGDSSNELPPRPSEPLPSMRSPLPMVASGNGSSCSLPSLSRQFLITSRPPPSSPNSPTSCESSPRSPPLVASATSPPLSPGLMPQIMACGGILYTAFQAASAKKVPDDLSGIIMRPPIQAVNFTQDPLVINGIPEPESEIWVQQTVDEWMVQNAGWPIVPHGTADDVEHQLPQLRPVASPTYRDFVRQRNEEDWQKYLKTGVRRQGRRWDLDQVYGALCSTSWGGIAAGPKMSAWRLCGGTKS